MKINVLDNWKRITIEAKDVNKKEYLHISGREFTKEEKERFSWVKSKNTNKPKR